MTTAHPYVPMPDGQGLDYDLYNITGLWHDNGYLDIVTSELQSPIRIEWYPIVTACGNLTVSHRFDPANPAAPQSYIIDGMAVLPNGLHYYGEYGSIGNCFTVPPIPKITLSPIAGERIDSTCQVYINDTSQFQLTPVHQIYRTLQHYDTWGILGAGDYWRTSLYETDGQKVYNYMYQRDVGLVAFWHGKLDPVTNAVVGFWKRRRVV